VIQEGDQEYMEADNWPTNHHAKITQLNTNWPAAHDGKPQSNDLIISHCDGFTVVDLSETSGGGPSLEVS